MKQAFSIAVCFLVFNLTYAQVDNLYYEEHKTENQYLQLRPDSTYSYFYSSCTFTIQHYGKYAIKNDTVELLSYNEYSLPYFYKTRRIDSSLRNNFFKLQIENTATNYQLKVILNDTLQIMDVIGLSSNTGQLSSTFTTSNLSVNTVTLLYRKDQDASFTSYTIPAKDIMELRLFCRGNTSLHVMKNKEMDNRLWLLKNGSIKNTRTGTLLYLYPQTKKRKNNKL